MITSIFGAYAQKLQALIDARQDKFRPAIWSKYFDLGVPQMSLSYLTAIGRTRVEAAASVVAHGAAAPLRSRAGLDKLSGEVAAIKVKRAMDERDWRNYLTIQNLNMAGGEDTKKTQILKLIWDDVQFVVDSVTKRIDIMVAQALSTGVIAINTTTNPDGVIPGNIDLLVPSDHKTFCGTSTRYWSVAATAKPITDIAAVVVAAEAEGVSYEKVLMTSTKMRQALASTEVTTLELNTLEKLNNYLQDSKLPIIETIDLVAPIEKDGVNSNITAWDGDNIVFLPAGKQGIIHNSVSIEEVNPVAGVVYAKQNNILVSKWGETEPFGEYTRGEIAAFPGLETADSIWIFDTAAMS